MKKYFPAALLALFIVYLGHDGIFFGQAHSQTQNTPIAPESASKPAEKPGPDLHAKIPLDPAKLGDPLPRNLFIELSKLINPTVVSITTASISRGSRRQSRDPLQEFLEDFWGGRGMPQPGRQQGPKEQMQGLGTGLIIRDNGLIITNNHVVDSGDVIKVQLDSSSNKFYEAEIIGRDARTDIALIKIDAKKPLPFARLGSSKDVQVGEWVAAFGNPYGHAHTMTKGIVSAIGREIAELNRFPFIQTDASINPGNSGGPLVNTLGLVIGVNSAIDARAQGIGFAIPIDNVKQIVEILEKDGRVKRGFLGITRGGLNEAVASQLGLDDTSGVLVNGVFRDGPAAKAGIEPYDLIISVNNKKISSPVELQDVIAALPIGAKTKIQALRFDDRGRKQEKTFTVTVEENPQDRKQERPTKKYFGQKAPFDLGFKIADWSEKLANEFGIPETPGRGPIITEVDASGAAAAAGFQPGDMILDVNRQGVERAADVIRHLRKGRNIMRLVRGNMIMIVTIGG